MVPRASEGQNRIYARDTCDTRRIWKTFNVKRFVCQTIVGQYRHIHWTDLAMVRTAVSATIMLVILAQVELTYLTSFSALLMGSATLRYVTWVYPSQMLRPMAAPFSTIIFVNYNLINVCHALNQTYVR